MQKNVQGKKKSKGIIEKLNEKNFIKKFGGWYAPCMGEGGGEVVGQGLGRGEVSRLRVTYGMIGTKNA